MTVVFICWGHYSGFKAVLKCAKARANCPVVVISENDPKEIDCLDVNTFEASKRYLPVLREMMRGKSPWLAYSICRWLVLYEHVSNPANNVSWPIFCADWDVMILRDLNISYGTFMDDDYTVSHNLTSNSAAYGINNITPLKAFYDTFTYLIEKRDPLLETLNDMSAWQRITDAGAFKVGDLFQIHDGAVFDHSIHAGGERFDMDGEAKRIIYADGQAYFRLHDGTHIVASTIHCWGTYKQMPGKILLKLGID